ncbi:MAG: hypothetical protein J6R45_03225 [Clostridia bacterium]|nr:hypothetical protein [Clostridia bacterium]MBO5786313.1 hypothetical protein [Clostridia bacterium]
MKKFIKAVGQIDEELLERYDNIEKSLVPKRKRTRVLKIAALAACLCLVFASVFAVLELASGDTLPTYSGVPTESGDIPTQSGISGESGEASQFVHPESSVPEDPPAELDAIYSGEPLWLNPSNGSQGGGGDGEAAEPPPASTLFYYGMTAVGRVKEISPDTYARIGASASELRYRIAVMEITEAVYGNNIPDEIYLMIPSYLDVEALLNYDEMIFAFKQKGFESYVLANETKKRAEAFSVMFQTVPGFAEFCFIPFTDGVFDISLWREKGFNNQFYFQEEYMYEFFTNPGEYQVQIGYTLGQAKKAILDTYAEMRYPPLDRVLYSDIFNSDAAKAVLEYCTPFKNGIFAQDAVVHNSSAIFFERYIYGFPTNEVIRIRESDENATYYGERFTEEEIERLPNIANFFERTDIYSLSPMHTDIGDKHTVSKPMLSGNYVKLGGKIYSIARIAWKIVDDRNWYCLDDSYFLISEDGSATLIEREDLRAIVGDEFVTSFKYNEFIEEIAICE